MADDEPETFTKLWQLSDRARHQYGAGTLSQIQILTQRNYELTTLVTTLVDLLASTGAVDPVVLIELVDNQLGEPPIAAVPAAAPAAAPARAVPTGPMTLCARCGNDVPQSTAEMTPTGLVCGPCSVAP